MSKNNPPNPYGQFKNANSYNQMGVVVLAFETVNVNGRDQIYATGFNLEKPQEKVSIALMQEEGFRKNIAQVHLGITEKTDGDETRYYNTYAKKEITKEDYEDCINNSTQVQNKFNTLLRQRSTAENLLTKRSRINTLPAVLMFDNANKLGSLDDINIYEARWVSGISGNTLGLNQEMDQERAFTVTHRKILGNIQIKYDSEARPYWGDIHAIDRINNLTTPKPSQSPDEQKEIALYNRDVLRFALSNVTTTSDGYKVERKPYTCFNLYNKSGEHMETVRIHNEEYADSRYKEGDPILKHQFMRPKDAPETVEAYMYHQDAMTTAFVKGVESGELSDTDYYIKLRDVYNADKARAVISSLMFVPFTPVITSDLAEQVSDSELKADIAIKANSLKSMHKKLVLGDLEPRMINGTTYAIGPKYLERFIGEVQPTKEFKLRPIKGLVETQPLPDEMANNLPNKHRVFGYTDDRKLIFSEMYICPKKWDRTAEASSLFVGLITTPHQSYKSAVEARIMHTDLVEAHAPAPSSFRFIGLEYKDYLDGTKEVPSIKALLNQKIEHIKALENTKEAEQEYRETYRVLGIHKVPQQEPVASAKPSGTGSKKTVEMSSTGFDMS